MFCIENFNSFGSNSQVIILAVILHNLNVDSGETRVDNLFYGFQHIEVLEYIGTTMVQCRILYQLHLP